MLCVAEQGICSKMVEELQNDFTEGDNEHPSNTTEVYKLFMKYKRTHPNPEKDNGIWLGRGVIYQLRRKQRKIIQGRRRRR